MALQDPQDPSAPAPWEWPAELQVDPRVWGIPMEAAAPEYPMPGAGSTPLPPPPPPPPKTLGPGGGVVEETAGPTPEAKPTYRTPLTADEENKFQAWAKSNKVPWQDTPDADYDMRGYWKAKASGDANAKTEKNAGDGQQHFPDTWKTPYHATFSNESIYAPPDAPRWQGDVLYDKTGKVIADERTAALKKQGPPPPLAAQAASSAPADWAPADWHPAALLDNHLFGPGTDPFVHAAPEQPFDINQLDPGHLIDQGANSMARPALPPGPGSGDQLASQRAEGDVENRANALAADPWKATEDEGKRELERADQQRAAIIDLQKQQAAQADANAQRLMEAHGKAQAETQRIMNEATTIANTHIVRDRRSVGRRFFDGLLGAFGGLVSARTGGPNVGLQMVLKGIDDDVEDQKADLSRRQSMLGMKRNFIADELGRSGDMFKAQEMYRLALHDTAIAQINNEAMKYDPNGTRAQMLAKLKMGVQQAKGAAVDAMFQRNLKTAHDQAQVEGQLLDNEGKRQKILAAMGAGGPTFVPTEKDYQSAAPPAGFKGTPKQWLELRSSYFEGQNKQQQFDSGGKVGEENRQAARERGGMGLSDYDEKGNPIDFVPKGTPETFNKLRDKVAATKEIVHLMDEAMSLRTGWTSDVGKSEEWQRLRSLWGAAILRAKDAGGLGAISGADMELIEKWLGTDDPTKMRGVEKAVDQSRRNFIGGLKTTLQTSGMSGKGVEKFDIPNQYGTKAKQHSEDADYTQLLNGEPANDHTGTNYGDALQALYKDASINAPAVDKATKPTADQAKRDEALEKLRKLVDNAKSPTIRRDAQRFLELVLSKPADLPTGAPQPVAGGSIWGGQ